MEDISEARRSVAIDHQGASASTHDLTPPINRGDPEAARSRFGAERVNLLLELMQMGDPLADAVVAEIDELGPEARRKLNHGIQHGLALVDVPPLAIRAFLAAAEQVPDWVDPERLKRGSDAYLSIGQLWIILSLGPGSLTHTYSSGSIARVLVRTGNLVKMARRRLIETGVWNIETVLPGGLQRGANGYVQNLQVRLLHARVRTTLLLRAADQPLPVTPINQVEMARTWLDFTYVPFSALGQLGITFTDAEILDLYHLWQYIAYLLGVDERLYRHVTDQHAAEELLALIDSLGEGANEDSKALTQAMLAALSELLRPIMRTSPAFTFDFVSALTRRLHGDELADKLGVKRTWVSHLLPFVAGYNRLHRFRERLNPRLRQQRISRTADIFRAQASIDGLTTYQHHASESMKHQLPQTVEN